MELNLKIPEKIYLALRVPEHEKEKTLLVELAISLYQRGILSFGKARELARLSKIEFHQELGRRKIERHYDLQCLEEDIEYGQENVDRKNSL